jgi:hypothetical protein
MADPIPGQVFFGSDNLERSVSVVIEPRDFVTGGRVPVPLQVRLKDVAAEPIAARSGVYCFTDLKLPAADYTVQVRPLGSDMDRFFDAEQPFTLEVVPVPAQPLKRNLVPVILMPRPGYPFDGQATLARGRLLKASNRSPIAGAQIMLILQGSELTPARGQTDERGEFALFFPLTSPGDDPLAGLKNFTFKLKFKFDGLTHLTGDQTVKEGTTVSIKDIEFPGT